MLKSLSDFVLWFLHADHEHDMARCHGVSVLLFQSFNITPDSYTKHDLKHRRDISTFHVRYEHAIVKTESDQRLLNNSSFIHEFIYPYCLKIDFAGFKISLKTAADFLCYHIHNIIEIMCENIYHF